LCLALTLPAFAQYVTVASANIHDSGSHLLASGVIVFAPVDSSGNPLSYQAGGGGSTITSPTVCSILNGAIVQPCLLANSALTNPLNVCFATTIKNGFNQVLLGGTPTSGYQCVQTATTNFWCTSGSCNFDQYFPQQNGIPIVPIPPPTLTSLGAIYAGDCSSGLVAGYNTNGRADCAPANNITLQTNGTNNGSQVKLNLTAGSNISIVDNGTGTDTITASASGAGITPTPGSGISQFIQQTVGTDFGANQFNRVRYVTSGYNWQQSIIGTLTAGTPAVITLSPCPSGVYGNDPTGYNSTNPLKYPLNWIYIFTGGTPERVQMTGLGDCVPGNASGTISFTPAYNHTSPYIIGSASIGAQEALMDAETNGTDDQTRGNWVVDFLPSNPPSDTANAYEFLAPVNIQFGPGEIDCHGAQIAVDNTDFGFNFPLDTGSLTSVTLSNCRLGSTLTYPGAPITATACSGTTATITSTLNPAVGSWVDVQKTDATFFWGPHQVVTSSASNWTYTTTASGCPAGTASASTPGANAYLHTGVLDNGNNITFRDNLIQQGSYLTGRLTNGITVIDDEKFNLDGLNTLGVYADNSSGVTALDAYVGNIIYAPGPFSGTAWGSGAAVGSIKNLNTDPECEGNGVTWLSGNTLSISDSVIQGASEWEIMAGNLRGGSGTVTTRNVYTETGGGSTCWNPQWSALGGATEACFTSGSIGASCNVGGMDLVSGNWQHEAGFVGSTIIGQAPVFGSTSGSTTYDFWVVANDTTLGTYSVPVKFGSGLPTATFTIGWPRIAATTPGDTITYDVLAVPRIATSDFPETPYAPYGTGNYAIQTGLSQCAHLVCTLSVTYPVSLSSYTVQTAPTLFPSLLGWPENAIGSGGQESTDVLSSATHCTAYPQVSIIAKSIVSGSPGCIVTGGQAPLSNSNQGGLGTIYQFNALAGGPSTIYKGRVNFEPTYGTIIKPTAIITVLDSNPFKTMADPSHRPKMDAADNAIGTDTNGGTLTTADMALTSGVGFNLYAGSPTPFDGSSWIKQITPTTETSRDNQVFEGNVSILGTCVIGCGPLSPSGTQVIDTFHRANGSIGSNWTQVAGTWTIASNQATITNDATYSFAAYTGSSFTVNQYATITIGSIVGSFPAAGVRMSSSVKTGYFCEEADTGSPVITIGKYVAGSATGLATSAAIVVNPGDVVTCQVVGTTISAFQNGVLEATATDSSITSGSPGMFGLNNGETLTFAKFAAGDMQFSSSGPIQDTLAPYVANLPACTSALEGGKFTVTDATATTWGSTVVGGGSNHVGVRCNGTNWTIFAD